jgi:hypothetical protein
MHPRWPHGNAAARPRLLQSRLLRPRLLRPRSARRWPAAGQIALLAAAAALVAGCGHSHSAAPAATKAASHPATPCGTAKTPANVPVQIQVAKGKVACADAMTI